MNTSTNHHGDIPSHLTLQTEASLSSSYYGKVRTKPKPSSGYDDDDAALHHHPKCDSGAHICVGPLHDYYPIGHEPGVILTSRFYVPELPQSHDSETTTYYGKSRQE